MKSTIVDGMNCLDVGCHRGSVLDQIVKLSPSGRHAAVEPLPYKAGWLRRKYPGVEVFQVADGVVDFYFNQGQSGFSGLAKPVVDRATDLIQVPCRRLDDLVPADRRIGFIKIDVEGAEVAAFRGARRILSEDRPTILFECATSCLAGFDQVPADMFASLVGESGYDIFLIKDRLAGGPPLDLPTFEASMKYPFQAFNFLAAPRG